MFCKLFKKSLSYRNLLLACGLLSLCFLSTEAQANTNFSDQGISFDQDTIVEFEFIQSHGSYRTVFGMINRTTGKPMVIFQENQPYDNYGVAEYASNSGDHDTGSTQEDYVGTFGKTVTPGVGLKPVKSFGKPDGQILEVPFQANHQYVFFLDVYNERGEFVTQFLSTESAANFDGNIEGGRGRDSFGRAATGIALLWDDGGRVESTGMDFDFDDFVVEAGGFLFDPCPDVN
jgi:hypothetical protein